MLIQLRVAAAEHRFDVHFFVSSFGTALEVGVLASHRAARSPAVAGEVLLAHGLSSRVPVVVIAGLVSAAAVRGLFARPLLHVLAAVLLIMILLVLESFDAV